jgi:outer membrane protein assembly factor BamE (lipoprotein component of BamABCDE complex)
LIVTSLFISACGMQRAEVASNAKSSMISMTKEQILQCMGTANSIQNVGNTETWKYFSGDKSAVNAKGSDDKSSEKLKYCEITLTFDNNGTVSFAKYSGNAGGIFSDDEQCAYAVKNCVR